MCKTLKVLSLVFCLQTVLLADVSLPKIIDSHMILQREKPVRIWGWADGGEKVKVDFAGQSVETIADNAGKWMVTLKPMAAETTPQKMSITGKNQITLEDILIGEVWLASGQSNMEWAIRQVVKEEQELAKAEMDNKLVRSFHVSSHLQSAIPLDDTVGSWVACREMVTRKTGSAVGFFFALKLQQTLGVPVAFIDSNWGGQRIECFISNEGYKAVGMRTHYPKKGFEDEFIQALKRDIDSMQHAVKEWENGIRKPIHRNFHGLGRAQNGIYNAMIAPLVHFSIRGAIWYQGESNRKDKDYFEKLQALSAGWSEVFNTPNIPLYLVQIAPYQYQGGKHSILCDTIWQAQYKAAKEIKGVQIVAIHDTNIPLRNIHPPHKKQVGERLAAMALKDQYKQNVIATGPSFAAAFAKGNTVIISFNNIDQGLSTVDGNSPSWFETSEDGKSFVPATATIKDNTVELKTTGNPKNVRMGWYETAIPNLCDKNGWPVFAFGAKQIRNSE